MRQKSLFKIDVPVYIIRWKRKAGYVQENDWTKTDFAFTEDEALRMIKSWEEWDKKSKLPECVYELILWKTLPMCYTEVVEVPVREG